MERRPEFTIIAGPNGASKSRLGAFYSNVKAFDGDLLAMSLRRLHPEWIDRWIDGTVVSTLMSEAQAAIDQHRSFAFESNFASQLPIYMMQKFKDAGYKICLVYFGLASKEESLARVMQRHNMGGHNVSQEVIAHNFDEGIKQVRSQLAAFENIMFIDGTSDFGDIIAMHISRSGKHIITDHPAAWFHHFFKDAFDALVSSE